MLKTLAILVAITVLGASVAVYAKSLNTTSGEYEGPKVFTVGGPDDEPASIKWTVTNGKITGAQVTWTPEDRTTTISVKVGGSIGWARVRVDAPGTAARTDFLTIKPPVDAGLVSSAKVDISGR